MDKLNKVLEALMGLTGVVMILVETYAVFGRNVLQISTPWTDEMLKLLFIWTIFIGAAMSFNIDDAICLTLIEDSKKVKNNPPIYGTMKIIQYVSAVGVAIFMSKHLFTIISTQLSTGEATTVMKYPLWILNLGILVGMFFTIFFGIIKLVDCKKYFVKK